MREASRIAQAFGERAAHWPGCAADYVMLVASAAGRTKP